MREKFLEFSALQGICKSFTAEVTKEFAKFAEFNFEALCFNEDVKFNDPFL
jgi:tRNA A58 N-methylase Trm61